MLLVVALGLLPTLFLVLSGRIGWGLISLMAIPAWFVNPGVAFIAWFSFMALARAGH